MLKTNDLIGDLFTRIRNGQRSKKLYIYCSNIRIYSNILKVLYTEGYIRGYKYISNKNIKILLKYCGNLPAITKIGRVSKPGRRIYSNINSLWKLNNNLGIFILSTSKGVMSDKFAKIENMGGEILGHVS